MTDFWSRSRSRSFRPRSHDRFLVSVSVSISVSHSLVSVLVLVSLCSGLINKPAFLYHLFPHPRDTSVLSRLRTATRFPRPVSRTKKYCSFINYALNHYQVPSCNSASGLDPSLYFIGLLCCLHVF